MLDLVIRGGTRRRRHRARPPSRRRRRRPRRPHRRRRRHSTGSSTTASTVDADGLVVSPGFVDIHTHYDAQVLWDRAVTPVTAARRHHVIGGNCGFSIAPLAPEHVDYVMRMMARVEGMPLERAGGGPVVGLAHRSASGSTASTAASP